LASGYEQAYRGLDSRICNLCEFKSHDAPVDEQHVINSNILHKAIIVH
jgi:hypothetical protein